MGTRTRDAGSAAGSKSPADAAGSAGSTGSTGSEGGVTLRWRYPIEPAMSAGRALAVIFETLLDVMADNERGVVEQRDPEFLHDYRVAVRRTRSALSLFGAVLPPAMLEREREFFKDLGRRTNNARDLDVLLVELPAYAESIPTSDRECLVKLEQCIVRENARHYAAVRKLLEGESYGRAIADWRSDLAELSTTRRGGSMRSCAAGAIRAAAAQVDRRIEQIEREPDAVHRLRIRFKRLRYALEFSLALTPAGEAESFIGSLKRLQDQLGTYQDVDVHRRRIAELVEGERADPALGTVASELMAGLRKRRDDFGHSIQKEVAIFRRQAGDLERVLIALG